MKNLLIYYMDGNIDVFQNLTDEKARKYIDQLETGAWE